MNPVFEYSLKIELEDVDAIGVVFYANYYRYIERARRDVMSQKGLPFSKFLSQGYGLVVSEIHSKFHAAAKLDDTIYLYTRLKEVTRTGIILEQLILKEKCPELNIKDFSKVPGRLHLSEVTLVATDLKTGRFCKTPEYLISLFQ